MSSKSTILLYNRETQEIESECIYKQSVLNLLYGNWMGLCLSRLFLKRAWFTRFLARKERTANSAAKICSFIQNNRINVNEILEPLESFKSFNEFFIRKLKPESRPIDFTPKHLISPADARLLCYRIQKDAVFPIKARSFTVETLLKNKPLAENYQNGICCVFRLAPADYHRFCFIDDGQQSPVVTIPGYYHSVNQLVLRRLVPVFTENYREYCILNTKHFGQVVHMDVGALAVGRIVQRFREGGEVRKGAEKGYFEFGCSTIVQLFKEDTVEIDNDIIRYSNQDIETLVKYGSAIGKALTV